MAAFLSVFPQPFPCKCRAGSGKGMQADLQVCYVRGGYRGRMGSHQVVTTAANSVSCCHTANSSSGLW